MDSKLRKDVQDSGLTRRLQVVNWLAFGLSAFLWLVFGGTCAVILW